MWAKKEEEEKKAILILKIYDDLICLMNTELIVRTVAVDISAYIHKHFIVVAQHVIDKNVIHFRWCILHKYEEKR